MGMAGITISEERLNLYDFTNTYYAASQKLVVLESNTAFDECKTSADVEAVLKSLENEKIGYQIGTTGNWYVAGDADWGFDGFANVEAKGYSTAQLAIQDLVNGQIYAVVVDEAPGAAMVKAFNK
jgi:polar amino acid transport system substrate-binding protein